MVKIKDWLVVSFITVLGFFLNFLQRMHPSFLDLGWTTHALDRPLWNRVHASTPGLDLLKATKLKESQEEEW